jgi:hypothetical protein
LGQLLQIAMPTWSAYFPATQFVHVDAVFAENFPLAHSLHDEAELATSV